MGGRGGKVDNPRRLHRHGRRGTGGRSGEVNNPHRLRRHGRHTGGATAVREPRFLYVLDDDVLNRRIELELALVRRNVYTK